MTTILYWPRGAAASTLVLGAALMTTACSIAPKPFSAIETASFGHDKLARVTAEQAPLTGPIDLYEAMARAIKYNLDARVELMQRDLRLRELDLSTYKMLPNLVAETSFSNRNNDYGGSSQSLLTGQQSLEASTSQERRDLSADLGLSWNILDFGLSYVRARQAGDEAMIAEEARRKVVVRVVEDVRTAYWRAVSSERLIDRLRSLETRVLLAQANSRKLFDARETSPITAITYERELVDIRREIERLEGDLKVAKSQLAALINVKPGTPLKLIHRPHGTGGVALSLSPDEMIDVALRNRPELAEAAYKSRINVEEAKAALLELLPGVQLYLTPNYDSNGFLFNNDWVSWGARASWNLMRVVQYPAHAAIIKGQDRLLNARALAVTMAVLTQVHVSRIRYAHARKELATAAEYLDVQNRLIAQMRAQALADRISEQTLIREEMNTLVAEVKRDLAFASLQTSIGNVYSSLGLDPVDAGQDLRLDTKALAAVLRAGRGWRGGFVTSVALNAPESQPGDKP